MIGKRGRGRAGGAGTADAGGPAGPGAGGDSDGRSGGPRALRVLVYSSSRTTRADVIAALGPHPDPALPRLEFVEAATGDAVVRHIDAGRLDLAILDGEAAPTGGMGLARQWRDEADVCPVILVIIGRRDDAWLARWCRADAVVTHPVDPFEFAAAAVALLRDAAGVTRA